MEKEFIPYEQALALKELGFNRRTLAQYSTRQGNEWVLTFDLSGEGQYPKGSSACIAPTFSQAFRWFREKYSLEIILCPDCFNEPSKLLREYKIISIDKSIILDQCTDQKHWIRKGCFVSYEEAELECLKKLIEIVNNK